MYRNVPMLNVGALHKRDCTYVWVWHRKTRTRARGRSSPRGQDHYGEEILPIGSTTEERGRVTLLPVTLLFTQSSWRSGSWFPLNEPPAGCLNRPLINPSVGSLLRPQPSEEGSNPAKQTERRPSAQRGGQNRVREGLFFFLSLSFYRVIRQRKDFTAWILQIKMSLSLLCEIQF